MKKTMIIVLITSVILHLTACQSPPAQPVLETTAAKQDSVEQIAADEEITASEEETVIETEEETVTVTGTVIPEPEYHNIGDTVNIGHWEITLVSSELVNTIEDQFGEQKADEGVTFALLTVNIVNNYKVADKFIDTFNSSMDIDFQLLDSEEESYRLSTWYHFTDRDGGEKWINPLSSHDQKLVFELPNTIIDGEQELILKLIPKHMKHVLFRIR